MTIDELIKAAEADGWNVTEPEPSIVHFERFGWAVRYDSADGIGVAQWWHPSMKLLSYCAEMAPERVLAKLRELKGRAE